MLKLFMTSANMAGPAGESTSRFLSGLHRRTSTVNAVHASDHRPSLRLRCLPRLFMAAAMMLVACSPDVQVPTWNQVDVPALIQRLDNPSGSIESVVVSAALIAQLAVETEDLVAVSQSVASLQPSSPSTEPTAAGTGSSGTVAFLEIACPGPDLEQRVTDFSSGWIRVDAPGLTVAQILNGTPSFRGDALLSFVNCRRGDTELDGAAAVFIESERFGFNTQLVLATGEPPTVSTLLADGLVQGTELRFISNAFGELTIATNLENPNVVQVTGQDGQLTCQVDQASCQRE